MNGFVEVKTADLIGPALNWAVAQAEGVHCYTCPNSPHKTQFVDDEDATFGRYIYCPSTDWAQGGPLLDHYGIELERIYTRKMWTATLDESLDDDGDALEQTGHTALIAICRAVVVAKLGGVVQAPAELVGIK